MSEPIYDGGEMDEAEEGAGELFVTSADAALGFDAAKEVLNVMTTLVVSAMEARRMPPTAFWRDAATGSLGVQSGAKDVGVKALVGHDPAVSHAGQHRKDGVLIVLLAGRETNRQGPPAGIDNRRELGVQPTFGPAHRLRSLAAPRIGSVLMQFDVRAVQVPQFAFSACGQDREHPSEQPAVTPAAVTRIDRTPRSVTRRQIPPRHARAQDKKHGTEHHPVIFGRPTTARHCAITPSPRFSRRIRSIFLAAPIAARVSTADLYNTCADSDSAGLTRFHHFENTP